MQGVFPALLLNKEDDTYVKREGTGRRERGRLYLQII